MTSESSNKPPIYTIGYGNRKLEDFRDLLWKYKIDFLIDVRTRPYSKFNPDFSQNKLKHEVKLAGLAYVYMGDVIGGQPTDPECYTADGKVNYEVYSTKAFYQGGIERLKKAYEQGNRVVVMCSELRPEECHRTKLISESLVKLGVEVQHINEYGALQAHEDIMKKVMGKLGIKENKQQPSLFDLEDEPVVLTSRKSYKATNKEEEA